MWRKVILIEKVKKSWKEVKEKMIQSVRTVRYTLKMVVDRSPSGRLTDRHTERTDRLTDKIDRVI